MKYSAEFAFSCNKRAHQDEAQAEEGWMDQQAGRQSYKPVQTRAGPASRAIVLHREIAHIKCQRMGINDKKQKRGKRQERKEREARSEASRRKREASKTDSQLAAAGPGLACRGRGCGCGGRVENVEWNAMPKYLAAPLKSHHPLPSPHSQHHFIWASVSLAPTMCDCQFQRHPRRCQRKGLKCFIALASWRAPKTTYANNLRNLVKNKTTTTNIYI